MTDVSDKIDELESTIEEQATRIESLEEQLEQQRQPSTTRRAALKGGGLLAMLGLASQPASASGDLTVPGTVSANAVSTDVSNINQMAASISLSTDRSVSNNTVTKLEFDTTDIEDTDVVTVDLANNEITVDKDGLYLIHAKNTWDGSSGWASGDRLLTRVDIDGSFVAQTEAQHIGANKLLSVDCQSVERLSANQTINTDVFHDADQSENISGSVEQTYLGVVKLG